MRIFCCSDTHGRTPPLQLDADIFLHAGDFYNKPGQSPVYLRLEEYVHILEIENWTWYAVRGNHDCVDPLGFFKPPHDITGRVERIGENLFLVGLGWAGANFGQLPNEFMMNKICDKVLDQCKEKMTEGSHSIFVTHYCPSSSKWLPEPGWFYPCIQRLMNKLGPLATIQGHAHRQFGRRWLDADLGLKVLCPGPKGALLDISPGNAEITMLK